MGKDLDKSSRDDGRSSPGVYEIPHQKPQSDEQTEKNIFDGPKDKD